MSRGDTLSSQHQEPNRHERSASHGSDSTVAMSHNGNDLDHLNPKRASANTEDLHHHNHNTMHSQHSHTDDGKGISETHEMRDRSQPLPPTGAESDNATSTGENGSGKLALAPDHPRANMPAWKWQSTLAVIFLTSMVNGYDVSNVANIQPRIYEAFGNIELLPWIGLSYSIAFFACLSFARKIILIFNMRWLLTVFAVVFVVGAAVAGSADSMTAIIVGRVIMGIGGAVVQQCDMSYIAVFSPPAESAKLYALMSTCWAIGLVMGGPIGSAFASDVTWRWAFYLNLPWVGICAVIAAVAVPSHSLAPPIPMGQRLMKIDPLGILGNMVAPVLFAVALTFSGPIWAWDDARTIVVWIMFAITFVGWFAQQYFCILTTKDQRAFPLHILPRTDLIPVWIATGCAGASYAITLYYTPLFFAFVKGASEMQQTVRLLPFILVFIVIVLTTGASLPAIGRYQIIYIVGGIFTLAGAAGMGAVIDSDTSQSVVMGLEAVLAIGLGMHWQHGASVCNAINKDPRTKVDSIVLVTMSQMGGIAVALAVGGAIYQNVGFNLLKDALEGQNYADHDIREALAGVSSAVWRSRDPEILADGLHAVAKIIAREYWLVTASGALCLVCGLLMKREKLDFGRPAKQPKVKSKKGDAEDVSAETV